MDIGFGDVVTPAPETVSYPVLLDDLPAPRLRACPKYTVVAEKFQALCALGMANSRMKDYFDLWMLLRDGELDDVKLTHAIEATFTRRRTAPRRLARRVERRFRDGCWQAGAMAGLRNQGQAQCRCTG